MRTSYARDNVRRMFRSLVRHPSAFLALGLCVVNLAFTFHARAAALKVTHAQPHWMKRFERTTILRKEDHFEGELSIITMGDGSRWIFKPSNFQKRLSVARHFKHVVGLSAEFNQAVYLTAQRIKKGIFAPTFTVEIDGVKGSLQKWVSKQNLNPVEHWDAETFQALVLLQHIVQMKDPHLDNYIFTKIGSKYYFRGIDGELGFPDHSESYTESGLLQHWQMAKLPVSEKLNQSILTFDVDAWELELIEAGIPVLAIQKAKHRLQIARNLASRNELSKLWNR